MHGAAAAGLSFAGSGTCQSGICASAGRRARMSLTTAPVPRLKPSQISRRQEEALDEALKNTFPASDPVSVEQPTTSGRACRS